MKLWGAINAVDSLNSVKSDGISDCSFICALQKILNLFLRLKVCRSTWSNWQIIVDLEKKYELKDAVNSSKISGMKKFRLIKLCACITC